MRNTILSWGVDLLSVDLGQYLLVGYIVFGLVVLLFLWNAIRTKQEGGIILFHLLNGAFFAAYPVSLLLLGKIATRQVYVFDRFGAGTALTLVSLASCYFLFLVGYYYSSNLSQPSNSPDNLNDSYINKIILYVGLIYLLIGLIGYLYQIVQLGGLQEALAKAACVRTSICGLDGKFVFLRQLNPFFGTGFVLLWCWYCAQTDKTQRGIITQTLGLVILTAVYAYLSALTNGRRDFYYPIFMCFAALLLSRRLGKLLDARVVLGMICIFLAILIWWLLARKGSSAYVQVVQNVQQAECAFDSPVIRYFCFASINTIQGFGDTFMHYVAMQNTELWQFGFLRDIRELPLQFVPSRLFGFERGKGVLADTSEFILGYRLSETTTGEEPPGLHGYLISNFGYIGLIFWFFIFGVIFKKISSRFRPVSSENPVKWTPYVFVLMLALELLRDGFMAFILKSRASWILFILVWWIFLKRRRKVPT